MATKTLITPYSYQEEIKKSRFIAQAAGIDDEDQALVFYQTVQHKKANHNAWAYRLGSIGRFFDDGEVSGTAGRPILAAIERQNLDHVVVVVTRYFGGIKLGSGGLLRAYGGIAAKCLQQASTKVMQTYLSVRIVVVFELLGPLYKLLPGHQAQKIAEKFDPQGVELHLRLPADLLPSFKSAITDMSRGAIQITDLD